MDFNLGRSSQKLTPLTLHATAHVIIWVSFVIVSVNTVNIASASKAAYLYLCKDTPVKINIKLYFSLLTLAFVVNLCMFCFYFQTFMRIS